MRLYHFVSISFLLTYIYTTPNNHKKHVILFDCMNVIIKENHAGFAKKIGYGNLASYTLTHWKHPGYRCLDMLEEISKHETQKPHIHITLKKRIMPRCLIELQEGKKTCSQVKNEISQCIEVLDSRKYFKSGKEKALMADIMNLVLDPESIASMIEPVKSTLQLIQKLKAAGHSPYIFANIPPELYATIQKKHADILNLFDGVIISSDVKTVKPDPAIFNHLLTHYNLDPHDCILIDDLEETVSAAQKLGMKAFVYDKSANAIRQLRKYGIKV